MPQGKAPTLGGWCSLSVMWSWTWSERGVVVNVLSTVGTETYLHPCSTGSAVQKLSVVTVSYHPKIRSPNFLASDCVLNSPTCFVKRSAVLFFVSSSRFVLSLSTVQALCNLAGVVLELLRLDVICVRTRNFLVHVIHDLALPHDVLQHRLAVVETGS